MMFLRNNISQVCLICYLVCFTEGCEKSHTGAESILLPAGRIMLGPGSMEIFHNDQRIEPELINEQCGGTWYRIPAKELDLGDHVLANLKGIFDYHHQWAEFQDEDGFWHPPGKYGGQLHF